MTFPTQSDVATAVDDSAAAELISLDDLYAIMDQVWDSYLQAGEELVPIPTPQAEDQISASVSVSGAFMGHVVFCTSHKSAVEITRILLDVEAGDVSDDDLADCAGEIANVIGGNLKSLLPGPSVLGLPIVLTSTMGNSMRWPDAQVVMSSDLTWRGEPVSVAVWAQAGE